MHVGACGRVGGRRVARGCACWCVVVYGGGQRGVRRRVELERAVRHRGRPDPPLLRVALERLNDRCGERDTDVLGRKPLEFLEPDDHMIGLLGELDRTDVNLRGAERSERERLPERPRVRDGLEDAQRLVQPPCTVLGRQSRWPSTGDAPLRGAVRG